MTQQRTPITEAASGRVGDDPPVTSAEDLAKMSPDQWQEYTRNMWQQVMPPVPEAPTTQATRTLADLMGPG